MGDAGERIRVFVEFGDCTIISSSSLCVIVPIDDVYILEQHLAVETSHPSMR